VLSWGSHVGGPLEVWTWWSGRVHGAAAALGANPGGVGIDHSPYAACHPGPDATARRQGRQDVGQVRLVAQVRMRPLVARYRVAFMVFLSVREVRGSHPPPAVPSRRRTPAPGRRLPR